MAKKTNDDINNTSAKQLTEEQIKAIQNYEDEFVELETFVEMVRQCIGMYIGSEGDLGLLNMTREVLQNSYDEANRKNSPCDRITVIFYDKEFRVVIEDNGKGIPFNIIEKVFTKQHMSTNYNKAEGSGNYTSGLNGVGAKIVNALSKYFVVESYILGKAARVEFNDGIVWDKGILPIPNPGKQGTRIEFMPSFDYMHRDNVSGKDVYNMIKALTMLTKIGTTVDFTWVKTDGTLFKDMIVNKDGIDSFIYMHCSKPVIAPIRHFVDNGTMRAEILFTFDLDNTVEIERINSFANFCITSSESTHVAGFIDGLTTYFRNHMNKVYLASSDSDKKKKKPLVVTSADIRTGLRAVVNVAHIKPVFTGQAKEKLENPEMKSFVSSVVAEALEVWSRNNPSQLQKLCKYFKDIAEIRTKNDSEKIKLADQYKAGINGLPSKFKDANKKRRELFIVEGDSAAGSFETQRDHATQGVFPIRGKMLNAFDMDISKCIKNAEISGIIAILGGGYGKNFDISKVEWEKIIFSADADSGGKHINTLLLRNFIRLFPQLIEAGRVYKTVPPLYKVTSGKNVSFFSDRISYIRYVQKEFSKNNHIADLDGRKFTTSEVTDFLYKNIDYVLYMDNIAGRYHIEPKLLEIYLYNYTRPKKDIIKVIQKEFRFMQPQVKKGVEIVEGIINRKANTLFMTDKLVDDCKEILDIIGSNVSKYYLVNGEKCSIYDIMRLYEGSTPSNVTRIKGLGEQKPKELAESVILPPEQGGYRTLVRYTMEDMKREINEIREFETNKYKLLENVGNVSRFDVME